MFRARSVWPRWTLWLFAFAASAPGSLVASQSSATTAVATNAPPGQPLSQRVVAYTIDASVNTDKKTVDATETLDYKNLTRHPLDTFPFHLYLNDRTQLPAPNPRGAS